jgi:hypothetical protein
MTLTRSLTAAALLLASACTPNYQPILITGIFPPEETDVRGACLTGGKPSVAQYSGALNAGVTNGYYMLLTLDSLLKNDELSPSSNTVVLNEVQYTYTTSPGPVGTPVGFPGSETATLSFSIKASSADNLVLVDLIGPQAKQALLTVPAASYAEYFTLKVQMQFRGQTLGNTALTTNSISFPIDIYNVGFSCPAGSVLKPNGPCGNTGQDGSALLCCSPDPVTGKCT